MPAIDSTRLMLELRSLAAEARRAPALGGVGPSTGTTGAPDFAALLKESLNQVNSMQQSAADLGTAFEQGQPGVDITRVMIEAQQATQAFRAMTEARNRLVSAYQEIMNMTV